MRFFLVVLVLCATGAMAADSFNDWSSSPSLRCKIFTGWAGMAYDNGQRRDYHLTLKMSRVGDIDDPLFLLEYKETGTSAAPQRILIDEENDAIMRVLVPTDDPDDYDSYTATGWAMEGEYSTQVAEPNTSKKRTIMLSYADIEGNRTVESILAYTVGDKRYMEIMGRLDGPTGELHNFYGAYLTADKCRR